MHCSKLQYDITLCRFFFISKLNNIALWFNSKRCYIVHSPHFPLTTLRNTSTALSRSMHCPKISTVKSHFISLFSFGLFFIPLLPSSTFLLFSIKAYLIWSFLQDLALWKLNFHKCGYERVIMIIKLDSHTPPIKQLFMVKSKYSDFF